MVVVVVGGGGRERVDGHILTSPIVCGPPPTAKPLGPLFPLRPGLQSADCGAWTGFATVIHFFSSDPAQDRSLGRRIRDVCADGKLPTHICERAVPSVTHAHHATNAAPHVTKFYTPHVLRDALFLLTPDYEFFGLPLPLWTKCVLEPEHESCDTGEGQQPLPSHQLYRRGDGAFFFKGSKKWMYLNEQPDGCPALARDQAKPLSPLCDEERLRSLGVFEGVVVSKGVWWNESEG